MKMCIVCDCSYSRACPNADDGSHISAIEATLLAAYREGGEEQLQDVRKKIQSGKVIPLQIKEPINNSEEFEHVEKERGRWSQVVDILKKHGVTPAKVIEAVERHARITRAPERKNTFVRKHPSEFPSDTPCKECGRTDFALGVDRRCRTGCR